jgi:hypothetical protein
LWRAITLSIFFLRLALAEAEPVEAILVVVALFALADGKNHDRHEVDHVAVDDEPPRTIGETVARVVREERLELTLEHHQMTQVRHVCPTRPQIFAEVQIGNDQDVTVQTLSHLRTSRRQQAKRTDRRTRPSISVCKRMATCHAHTRVAEADAPRYSML